MPRARVAWECGGASVDGACSFSRLRQDRLSNDLPDLGNIGVGHVATVHRRLRWLREPAWVPSFLVFETGANFKISRLALIGQTGSALGRLADGGSHGERARAAAGALPPGQPRPGSR